MNRSVILSVLDQAMLSAFNLALNLAFIAYATPAEFGNLVLVQAGAFFAISAQNALIIMPLNYLVPGRAEGEARANLSMLTSVSLLLTLLVTMASFGLSLLAEADLALFFAISFYFLTTVQREYVRNVSIVTGHMARAFRDDAIMAAVSAAAVVLLWHFVRPEVAALGGMAIGNLAVFIISRPDLAFVAGRLKAHLSEYRNVWKETRWALQGAMQNEVETRSYVFVVEHWRGAATLGTLQAGRIVLSPLMLVANGWRRIARPRIVADLHRGERQAVMRTLWLGGAFIGAATLIYGLALAVAWPLLDAYVFRQRYEDMQMIVFVWWLYSCVMGFAAVVVTLLEATRQFRMLAFIGAGVAGTIVLLLAIFALFELPLISAVLILTGVHAVEMVIYCILIRRGLPRIENGAPVAEAV